ncbi:MAG: leucine-rich repeat domain-containing protein [Clostridia bacterium]|nr:leucine-rich repeat domain-containing protein [Clostridia bacterium]
MKRVVAILLCLIAGSLLITGCVRERPEPTWEKTPLTGERKQVSFFTSLGVNYRIFNDDTAEVDSLDKESFSGAVVRIPAAYERYPVVGVCDGAFQGEPVQEVILPDTVRTIGARAFRQSGLHRFSMPDSVVFVGEDAFDGCAELREISLGKGLTVYPTGMCYGCEKLTELVIPEGVTVVGEECFSECGALESVSLPDSLREIGAYAFWKAGTDDLVFSVPAGVRSVGAGAFRATAWLRRQTDEFVVVGDGVLLRYNGSETDVAVPDGVKFLSDAFSGTAVTCVTLPASVTGECRDAWEETGVTEIRRPS